MFGFQLDLIGTQPCLLGEFSPCGIDWALPIV
jgi:hypothetical protein